MQTTKPQVDRVYLVVRDAASGRSKTMTVYNASFEETVKWLQHAVEAANTNDSTPHGGGDKNET